MTGLKREAQNNFIASVKQAFGKKAEDKLEYKGAECLVLYLIENEYGKHRDDYTAPVTQVAAAAASAVGFGSETEDTLKKKYKDISPYQRLQYYKAFKEALRDNKLSRITYVPDSECKELSNKESVLATCDEAIKRLEKHHAIEIFLSLTQEAIKNLPSRGIASIVRTTYSTEDKQKLKKAAVCVALYLLEFKNSMHQDTYAATVLQCNISAEDKALMDKYKNELGGEPSKHTRLGNYQLFKKALANLDQTIYLDVANLPCLKDKNALEEQLNAAIKRIEEQLKNNPERHAACAFLSVVEAHSNNVQIKKGAQFLIYKMIEKEYEGSWLKPEGTTVLSWTINKGSELYKELQPKISGLFGDNEMALRDLQAIQTELNSTGKNNLSSKLTVKFKEEDVEKQLQDITADSFITEMNKVLTEEIAQLEPLTQSFVVV